MTCFNVGDRVRKKNGSAFCNGRRTAIVKGIAHCQGNTELQLSGVIVYLPAKNLELAPPPRKHSELIKKWADDSEMVIETEVEEGKWQVVGLPCFFDAQKYREKPNNSEEIDEVLKEINEAKAKLESAEMKLKELTNE